MKLASTRIGPWLALGRIQSVCATPVLLSLGYASVTETILTEEILPLLVVGALGHYAVFAYNDIADLKDDSDAGKTHKPLVNGSIDRSDAVLVVVITLILTFVLSYFFLGVIPTVFFVIAAGIGIEYNHRSKSTVHGPILLGIWGSIIICMGGVYGGQWNEATSILSAAVAMQLFWITLAGDLEDLGHDEESLPELFGCVVTDIEYEDGYKAPHIVVSSALRQIGVTVIVVQMYLLLYLAFWSDGMHTVFASLTGILAVERSMPIMSTEEYIPDKIKKKIVIQTAFSVSTIILAAGSFLTWKETSVILVCSVGWNLIFQQMMYGSLVYYP